jgi:hypothetical protein
MFVSALFGLLVCLLVYLHVAVAEWLDAQAGLCKVCKWSATDAKATRYLGAAPFQVLHEFALVARHGVHGRAQSSASPHQCQRIAQVRNGPRLGCADEGADSHPGGTRSQQDGSRNDQQPRLNSLKDDEGEGGHFAWR